MRFRQDLTLRDYLAAGEETTHELLDQPNEFVAAIEQAYQFFAQKLWVGDVDLRPLPAVLALNAFMLFLSGVRTAFAGHEAAIFPPLRTALESACYAYRMVQDPKLEEVWLNRHKDGEALKASRRAFGRAVADTAVSLREVQPDYGDLVSELYDAAIDFGGHPNPTGIFGHLDFKEVEDSGFERINLAVLYPSDSWHLKRAMIACLDYAVVIGIVLIHTLPKVPAETAEDLVALNTIKFQLASLLDSESRAQSRRELN